VDTCDVDKIPNLYSSAKYETYKNNKLLIRKIKAWNKFNRFFNNKWLEKKFNKLNMYISKNLTYIFEHDILKGPTRNSEEILLEFQMFTVKIKYNNNVLRTS